jgi:hypothetical protein
MSSVETNLARPNLKIFRTTAFRLMAIYLLIFAMFVIGVLGYIGYHTNIILGAQLREQLTEEVRGLAADYRRGGLPRLIRVIERRSRQPGANIYLLTDQQGNAIAGNVDSLPKKSCKKKVWSALHMKGVCRHHRLDLRIIIHSMQKGHRKQLPECLHRQQAACW